MQRVAALIVPKEFPRRIQRSEPSRSALPTSDVAFCTDIADGRLRKTEVVRRGFQRFGCVVVAHRLPDVSEVVDGDIEFACVKIQRHDIAMPAAFRAN